MNQIYMLFTVLFCSLVSWSAWAQSPGDEYYGKASFYHRKFNYRTTSAGEVFHNDDYMAAHRTLPFGTLIEITNLANKQTAIVRVNDRGPFAKDRLVDISQAAARDLGMMGAGVADVKIKVLMIPREDGSIETKVAGELPKIELKTYAPIQVDSSGRYYKIKVDSTSRNQ
ncbi:MAG: septal ring lytic transglycosylase RlpA family protein [Spirosomataceae bacterium]